MAITIMAAMVQYRLILAVRAPMRDMDPGMGRFMCHNPFIRFLPSATLNAATITMATMREIDVPEWRAIRYAKCSRNGIGIEAYRLASPFAGDSSRFSCSDNRKGPVVDGAGPFGMVGPGSST